MKAISSLYLEFKSISLPVSIVPCGTTENHINLVGLSECCQSNRKMRFICASCSHELPFKTSLKAYKLGKELIKLTDEDINKVNEGISKGIQILGFFKDGFNIEQVIKSYLLIPDKKATLKHKKIYQLFRNALKDYSALCLFSLRTTNALNSLHIGILKTIPEGISLLEIIKKRDLEPVLSENTTNDENNLFLNLVSNNRIYGSDELNKLTLSNIEKFNQLIEQKLKNPNEVFIVEATTTEIKNTDLLSDLIELNEKELKKEAIKNVN